MVPAVEIPLSANKRDLFRGVLNKTDTHLPISAAGRQATRLAACSDQSFVFASGSEVYRLQCSNTRKRARSDSPTDDFDKIDHAAVSSLVSSAVSSAIADDYIVPRPFSSLTATPYTIHSTHTAEIQSIAADDTRVASVDAYGRCIITAETTNSSPTNKPENTNREAQTKSFVLSPVSLTNGDFGWAGVALRRNDPSTALVTRQFFRDVTVFDLDVPIRTIHTILTPYAAAFCGDGTTLAVSEGNSLAFYDSRAGENRGCVSRKTICSGALLSMDVSDDGCLVATGGMDRVLSVFDMRTMTSRDRWPSCLKYECAGTIMSRTMQGMAYVCSVDNEVACGAWSSDTADSLRLQDGPKSLMISGANTKSPRRAFGFRADVRLTGMARRGTPSEEIAVMSESGAFYMLREKPS